MTYEKKLRDLATYRGSPSFYWAKVFSNRPKPCFHTIPSNAPIPSNALVSWDGDDPVIYKYDMPCDVDECEPCLSDQLCQIKFYLDKDTQEFFQVPNGYSLYRNFPTMKIKLASGLTQLAWTPDDRYYKLRKNTLSFCYYKERHTGATYPHYRGQCVVCLMDSYWNSFSDRGIKENAKNIRAYGEDEVKKWSDETNLKEKYFPSPPYVKVKWLAIKNWVRSKLIKIAFLIKV